MHDTLLQKVYFYLGNRHPSPGRGPGTTWAHTIHSPPPPLIPRMWRYSDRLVETSNLQDYLRHEEMVLGLLLGLLRSLWSNKKTFNHSQPRIWLNLQHLIKLNIRCFAWLKSVSILVSMLQLPKTWLWNPPHIRNANKALHSWPSLCHIIEKVFIGHNKEILLHKIQ